MSGRSIYKDVDDGYSSSSSDGSFTTSQKAMISELQAEASSLSELQEVFLAAVNILTSLYKCSITTRNPAELDRSHKAAKVDVSFWQEHDYRHARDKFPDCSLGFLLHRLAKANTKRRQLFESNKRHVAKIWRYQETPIEEKPPDSKPRPQVRSPIPIATPILPSNFDTKSMGSRLTATTVSTLKEPPKSASSTTGRSQRTVRTNALLDNGNVKLPIPSLPQNAHLNGPPFFCPYCFNTIEPKVLQAWE